MSDARHSNQRLGGTFHRSLPSILLCCRPLGVGLGGKPLWEVASKLSPVPMAGPFCRVGNRRRRWPPTKLQEAENRTGLGSQEDRITRFDMKRRKGGGPPHCKTR